MTPDPAATGIVAWATWLRIESAVIASLAPSLALAPATPFAALATLAGFPRPPVTAAPVLRIFAIDAVSLALFLAVDRVAALGRVGALRARVPLDA